MTLVKSKEPEEKLAVVDLDDSENFEEIEFVVGVGVAKNVITQEKIANNGYLGISIDDLFQDIILDDKNYDPQKIVEHISPEIRKKNNTYFPGYKYLRSIGIANLTELQQSKHKDSLSLFNKYNRSSFRVNAYRHQFEQHAKNMSTEEIIQNFPAKKSVSYIPFQEDADMDLDAIQKFLIEHLTQLNSNDGTASNYRKLAVLYDKLKNGF